MAKLAVAQYPCTSQLLIAFFGRRNTFARMQSPSQDYDYSLSDALQPRLCFPGKPEISLQYDAVQNGFLDAQRQFFFPVFKGIPILIDPAQSIFNQEDFQQEKNLYFDLSKKGRLVESVKKLIPPLGYNHGLKDRYRRFLSAVKKKAAHPQILILGGSIENPGTKVLVEDEASALLETDVSHGPRTQMIVDGHAIPFQDHTFDGVVVHAVLEHVVDARRVVEEIHRVLKPEGVVYADTPFMQHVHGGPYDFVRFSHSGHRRLFCHFEELESGPSASAGTVMLWAYEYLMLALLGRGAMLSMLVKAFCRYTGFWMPWLDLLIGRRRQKLDAASGNYFMGRPSTSTFSDRELIGYYYRQAQ